MKYKIIALIITSIFIFYKTSGNQIQDKKKVIEISFNKILSNLDSIIVNSKDQNEVVRQHYDFIKNKISSGELPIVYDSTLINDFYGCAGFTVFNKEESPTAISFGNFIIDKYHKHPELVYAIIISTFQNAYDYYTNNRLFLISATNKIEKSYFEIDAMTVEALFLKTYIKDKSKLGYVEKYLLSDLDNGLVGSATLFSKTDLDLLHQMDNLSGSQKQIEKLLDELNTLGKDLIKKTSFANDDSWKNYCTIVTLNTYVLYSPQVIYDIVNIKKPIGLESFKLDNYPDNLKTINDVKKIITDNNKFFNFHDEIMQKFSDYYK
jgi:hypothetical protein